MADDIYGKKNLGAGAQDLEVIAQTYRVVSDLEAFEDLLQAWQARLDADAFGPQVELDPQLQGHIEQAMTLLDRSATPRNDREIERVLSETRSPGAVFSTGGYLVASNLDWGDLFDHRQGDQIDDRWVQPDSRETYRALVDGAARGGNLKHGLIRTVDRHDKQHIAEVFHLNEGEAFKSRNIAVRLLEPRWSDAVNVRLEEVFGLSEAEVQVCRLLLETRDTNEVARLRETSPRTVRLQLTSIFQKSGATSQVDLVRLLAMLCTRLESGSGSAMERWSDPYGREAIFHDKAGRKIAFTWFGAQDGDPFILSHGPSIGYALPIEADAKLKALGLKIIAISRPGYGNTEPVSGLDVVEDCKLALEATLEHLGLGTWRGIGLANGTIPLAALGSEAPARLKALICIGRTYPADTKARRAHLHKTQAMLYELALRAPWAARMIAKAGIRKMHKRGHEWYLEQAFDGSPSDLALLEDSTVRVFLRNASGHMCHQGSDAFARDLFLSLHDHIADLSALTCPVWFMNGGNNPYESHARLQELIGTCRDPRQKTYPDAGALVYYQHWPDLIDIMADIAKAE